MCDLRAGLFKTGCEAGFLGKVGGEKGPVGACGGLEVRLLPYLVDYLRPDGLIEPRRLDLAEKRRRG